MNLTEQSIVFRGYVVAWKREGDDTETLIINSSPPPFKDQDAEPVVVVKADANEVDFYDRFKGPTGSINLRKPSS